MIFLDFTKAFNMVDRSTFDLIVLIYMNSLNKTRSLFYIEVHG